MYITARFSTYQLLATTVCKGSNINILDNGEKWEQKVCDSGAKHCIVLSLNMVYQ